MCTAYLIYIFIYLCYLITYFCLGVDGLGLQKRHKYDPTKRLPVFKN